MARAVIVSDMLRGFLEEGYPPVLWPQVLPHHPQHPEAPGGGISQRLEDILPVRQS